MFNTVFKQICICCFESMTVLNGYTSENLIYVSSAPGPATRPRSAGSRSSSAAAAARAAPAAAAWPRPPQTAARTCARHHALVITQPGTHRSRGHTLWVPFAGSSSLPLQSTHSLSCCRSASPPRPTLRWSELCSTTCGVRRDHTQYQLARACTDSSWRLRMCR
jgi:hypothetical protein